MLRILVVALAFISGCGQLKDLDETGDGGPSTTIDQDEAQCEALAAGSPCADAITALQNDVNTLTAQITYITGGGAQSGGNLAACTASDVGAIGFAAGEWKGCDGNQWRTLLSSGAFSSVAFDGNSSCVTVSELFSGGTTSSGTVEVWMKHDGLSNHTNAQQYLFSHRSDYRDIALIYDFQDPNNPVLGWWFCHDGACADDLRHPVNLSDGQWHHIAGTFSGTTLTQWIDGVAVASMNTVGSTMYWGQSMWNSLGCNGTDPQLLRGSLREVRVSGTARYTVTFSPQWILDFDADTEALWHFNEGSGLQLQDVSGKHSGTLSRGQWVNVP